MGKVMRLSATGEDAGREDEDAAEAEAEAGNEFSNLSIGLVAFVCVIMDKLEIYCYYGEGRERGRKEGRKPDKPSSGRRRSRQGAAKNVNQCRQEEGRRFCRSCSCSSATENPCHNRT